VSGNARFFASKKLGQFRQLTLSGRTCGRGFSRARFVALQNRNLLNKFPIREFQLLDLKLQISIGGAQSVALGLAHDASRGLPQNFNFRPPVSTRTGIDGN
jgi:hypothetical protein